MNLPVVDATKRLARPWPVILLDSLLLVLGLANLTRAAGALWYQAHLPDLPLTVPLLYIAALGIFWGAVFIVGAVGLARRRLWARQLTLAAVTLYEGHVWLNRLLFAASDYARQTWPRDLLFSALLLALTWGMMNRPSVRRMFGLPARRTAYPNSEESEHDPSGHSV